MSAAAATRTGFRRSEPLYEELFWGRDRIALPLRPYGDSTVRRAVRATLAAAGAELEDYAAGRARPANPGDPVDIEVYLRPQPWLRQAYCHDPSRTETVLSAVISRAAADFLPIVGFCPQEMRRAGALACYLAEEGEKELRSARDIFLLHPLQDAAGKTILLPEMRALAEDSLFVSVVRAYIEKNFNAGKAGVFRSSLCARVERRAGAGAAAKQILSLWNIPFEDERGRVIVRGGINFKEQNLFALPDLRGVHVEGHFDCSGNFLQNLEGAPVSVAGNFYCNENRLRSLFGGPRLVGGGYYCQRNPLRTLMGRPADFAFLETDFGRFALGTAGMQGL